MINILWITRYKSDRILASYWDGFRNSVVKLKNVNVTVLQLPNKEIHFTPEQREIVNSPTFINAKFDFIYLEAVGAFEYFEWKRIAIPKSVFMNDQHGEYVRSTFIPLFRNHKFDILFTTYLSPLQKFHPYIYNNFKIEWLPFCVDPKIFKNYNLPQKYMCLQTGATTSGYYPLRSKARKELKTLKGYKFVSHPGYGITTKWPQGKDYAELINQSVCAISCTSTLDYVVLKTFEIPACNTLLCSTHIPEMEKLGFIPGHNMVELELSKSIYTQMSNILNDKPMIKHITSNGYKLIHSNHTTDIRAKQFVNAIKKHIG